jgi:hypothetical protein
MNESTDFTPKENFQANLYKDPAALIRNMLIRKLTYIVPSILLMLAWLITHDAAYAYVGYGLLLYQAVWGIFLAKRGIQTQNKVITKFEKKIQDKQGEAR